MSVGILALKVGLVATVTGASIATPILLNRSSGSVSIVSLSEVEGQNSVTSNGSNQLTRGREESAVDGSGSRNTKDSGSATSTEESREVSQMTVVSPESVSSHSRFDMNETKSDSTEESDGQNIQEGRDMTEASNSYSNSLSQSSSLSEVSASYVARTEDFDKKCFVVPTKSKNGVELLTCYEDQRINANVEMDDEEYDSLFHVYDPSKPSNPVEIDGSLMWNPSRKQLTASLTQKSDYSSEYTFTTTGGEWGGISNVSRDLLTPKKSPKECAIYKVSSEVTNSRYVLTCGNYSSFDEPKGIPLTIWPKNLTNY